MPMLCRVFAFALFYISFLDLLCAQDSSIAQLSNSDAVAFYNKYIGEEAHLYTGREHAPYDFRIKGHPYFESNLLQTGSVYYDGMLYRQASMAYDIVRDE